MMETKERSSDRSRADIETDGSMGGLGRAKERKTETDGQGERQREKKLLKDMSVDTGVNP